MILQQKHLHTQEVKKMLATYNPITGNYYNRKFKEIFPNTQAFIANYRSTDLQLESITDDNLGVLYALLYARYGNSVIAADDETQFAYEVFSIIFMYGPTWVKRLEVQDALRKLSIEDLQLGSKAIYNTALNPSTGPSTNTLTELNYINQQNTTNHKKSKLEAYGNLMALLETDVTEEFINRFKKLFMIIVQPNYPLWYITTPEEQEIIDKE